MYKELLKNKEVFGYLKSYNSFYFANGLASSFINILFFSSGSIISVLEYQMTYQFSQLFMFMISGQISNRLDTKHIYSAGNILRGVSLISTVLIGGIFFNQFFFGLIYGISGGLFWAGNAIVSLEVSRGKDRLNFLSINSTVSYIVSLVSPILGGIALELTPLKGVFRYSILFAATAILLIYSAIEVELLKIKENRSKKVRIIDSIYADRHIKTAFKSYFFFSSVYIFAISVVLPVYVFEVTHSYYIVGLLGAFMAGMSVVGNVFSPTLIKRGTKNISFFYAAIIIGSSFLFLHMTHPVLFSFITGGIALLFVAPINNRSMSNFMNSVDLLTTSFPYWINREYYLVAGRFSILLLTFILIAFFGINIYIPALTFASLTVIPMLSAVNIKE